MIARLHTSVFIGLLTVSIGASLSASAQFTQGNVVVLQVGDGTGALTNTGNPVFLKEFTATGAAQSAPTFSVTVPATGAGSRLVIGGTATSEGQLSLSADSLKLVFAGYDTSTANTTSLTGTTAANVPRVVDTVSVLGIAGRVVATSTAFSSSNVRSAVKGTGENYWAIGGNTGVQYMGTASAAAATVFTATTNLRSVLAQNGKLYFSTASGLSRIGRINSQPTSGTVTADTLITLGSGTTPSPYGIAVNAAETIVYVADDRTNGAGGIQKWALNGTTWSLADTLLVGAASVGARGLAVNWSGTYPVIFATTTESKLVRVVDSSFTAGFANTPVVLATAPANTAFRGVALSPRCIASPPATITAAGTTTICQGDTVTLNANTGAGYTHQWFNGSTLLSTTTSTLKATASGSYTVRVTAGGTCSATSPATPVTVNALPSTAFTTSLPTSNDTVFLCPGGAVTLAAGAGPAVLTYQWRMGATTVGTSGTYTANQPGSYTLVATNIASQCSATSAPLKVVRDSIPSTVTAAGPTSFCAGGSVVLNVSVSPATTYQWQLAGANIPNAQAAAYTAATSGSYHAILTRTNPSGTCAFTSDTISVTAKPLPQPMVQYNGGILSTSGTYSSYAWNLNGAPVAGATAATYTPVADGSYTVTVDSNGCAGTSVGINVTGLGVDGVMSTVVRLFPNPTATRVQIAPAGVFTVQVKDMQGRVLLTASEARELDLAPLADGIYFATVLDGAGVTLGTTRLIKALR